MRKRSYLLAMFLVLFLFGLKFGGMTVAASESFVKDTDGIDSGSTYLITIYDAESEKHYAWGIGSDGKLISVPIIVSGDTVSVSDSRIKWVLTREGNGYSMRVGSRYLKAEYGYGGVGMSTTQEHIAGMNYRDGHIFFQPGGFNVFLSGVYYTNPSRFIFELDYRESWAGNIVLYRQGNSSSAKTSGVSWEQDGRFWRCKSQDGTYLANQWLNDSGKWYYFDENGHMKSGWLELTDGTYYLYDDGQMAAAAELSLDGFGYAFDASGRMIAYDPDDPTRVALPDNMEEGRDGGLFSTVADDDWPINWINGKRLDGGKTAWKRDNRLCILAREAYYHSGQIVPLSVLSRLDAASGLNFAHIGTLSIVVSSVHPFEEYYSSNAELRNMISTDLMTHVGVYAEKTGRDAIRYVFVVAAY